jgi:HSP20 family protein
MADNELRPTEKKGVSDARMEGTKNVPYFSPSVDIYESEEELTLVADMPGVDGSGVEIDLKQNILTLQGQMGDPQTEGLTSVYREYWEGNYYRQFILSEIVDQAKITAHMADGVLRVHLPKVGKARPRKIQVHTS